MAFLTNAALQAAVADAIGEDANALPQDLLDVIPQANADAQGQIVSALVGQRGFTYQQAQDWDSAARYNRLLGIYNAMRLAGRDANWTDAQLARYDVGKELATAGVTIGNVAVDPGDPAAAERGGVGSGAFDTSGMTFGPDVEW